MMPPIQNTLRLPSPPSLPENLTKPPRHLIKPTPCHKNPGDGIDQPNQQTQETAPLLRDEEQDRFDLIPEEYPGYIHGVFGNAARLAGCGVLVCEDHVFVFVSLGEGGGGSVFV